VVFAAVMVALSSSARAGCTHPWVKTTKEASSLSDLAMLSSTDQDDQSQPVFPIPSPAKYPGPCARGACSQPLGFPTGSTIQVPTRVDLWGELVFKSPLLVPAGVGYCLEPECGRPRRFVSPIEHPPRCQAIS
jgi:hypothetical protein